ncbi:zinc-binding dehydrogenase [Croceicoccus sp. F390]|uniref:Zinc-binding dehydrogenase n=1 Tax=Croceicoccus esteveae TaxID=3075597 RepID=A0ABU2ZLT6_9SPHN|nr:zinc-binding dehydrogenase [Croceicoccus sp. F390]MDT0577176.1 zinc-binding dehydrogenase [Croceicoccus sp. F390]
MINDAAPEDNWFANFGQISFGTADLRRSVDFWEKQVGVGPWTIFEGLVMDALHQGKRIAMPFSVALTWHDGRLVELICAEGDGPSPLHDGLNRPIIGLQRLASVSENIARDAEVARKRGMELITQGEAAGQRFFHYKSDEAPGVILELLERTASFDQLIGNLQSRAAAWSPAARTAPIARAQREQSPGTMKVALLSDYGEPESFYIAEAAIPIPSAGEVRVAVTAAAVNPVDVKARRGLLHDWTPLTFPARLGGDIAGIVDAVGPGVTSLQTGDRVAGMLNPFADGGYAQFVTVRADNLARVPAGLDLFAAAALPTGALAGTALVESGVRPCVGERVLVVGAGGSAGRAAVLALLAAGAIPIAGIRSSSHAAVMDLKVEILDLEDAAAIAALAPVDAIADTVGDPLAAHLFAKVQTAGTIASIAIPSPIPPVGSTQHMCNVIARFDSERLARVMIDLVAAGYHVPIGRRFPLDQVSDAHRIMEAGGTGGKVLLVP